MGLAKSGVMEGVEEEGGSLGDLLARAREARHLTRDALGVLFGVEAFVIAHWESSGASPEVQPILERWIVHQASPGGEERDACQAAAEVVKMQSLSISACRSAIQRRIERSIASKEDAEDVVQATFVKLVHSGYRSSVPLKLAHDVARKALFSFWRKRALRAGREVQVEDIDVFDAPGLGLDESASENKLLLKGIRLLLAELLEALNTNQRDVVERWLEGLGHAEISHELGITPEQSREYLRQAQNKWKRWRDDPRYADLRDALGGILLMEMGPRALSLIRRVAQVVWKQAEYILVGCSLLGIAGIGGWECLHEQGRFLPTPIPSSFASSPIPLPTALPSSSGFPIAYPIKVEKSNRDSGQGHNPTQPPVLFSAQARSSPPPASHTSSAAPEDDTLTPMALSSSIAPKTMPSAPSAQSPKTALPLKKYSRY